MSAADTRRTRCPNSVAMSSAVSASSGWLIVAITPIFMSALMTSPPRSAMRLASSWTVMVSGITTSRITFWPSVRNACARCFSFSRARRTDAKLRIRSSLASSSACTIVILPARRRGSPRRTAATGLAGDSLPPGRFARAGASSSSSVTGHFLDGLRRPPCPASPAPSSPAWPRRPPPRPPPPCHRPARSLRRHARHRLRPSRASSSCWRRASSSAAWRRDFFLRLPAQLGVQGLAEFLVALRVLERAQPRGPFAGRQVMQRQALVRAGVLVRHRLADSERVRGHFGHPPAGARREGALALDLDGDGLRAAMREALPHLTGVDGLLQLKTPGPRQLQGLLRILLRSRSSLAFRSFN